MDSELFSSFIGGITFWGVFLNIILPILVLILLILIVVFLVKINNKLDYLFTEDDSDSDSENIEVLEDDKENYFDNNNDKPNNLFFIIALNVGLLFLIFWILFIII